MKAKLTYCSVIGCSVVRTEYVDGILNVDHGLNYGNSLVGSLSIHYSLALFLSNVDLENGDFACLALPEYFREGVSSINASEFSIKREIAPTAPNYENSEIAFLCR